MKLTALSLSVLAVLAVLAAGPALAKSLSVEEMLRTYNGVSTGDFNSNQEVEGRLVVGGNLTGNTIQTGFVALNPGPVQNVVVYGNSTIGKVSGKGEIVIGGNANTNLEESGGDLVAFIGGAFSGTANQVSVNTNQSGAAFKARFPVIDFAGLASYSTYLAGLTGSVWTTPDQNQKTLVSSPNAIQSQGVDWIASKVTVLFASMSQLASGTFSVNGLDSDETIIVNVSGTSGSWGLNGAGNATASARNILWNFYEAETISVDTAIIGSVLAAKAQMSGFAGSTEGSVIAKSINLNNGELHYQPFMGDLPEATPVAPVPVPAGLPLMVLTIGTFALARRAFA